jgi:hypothetical protein
MGADKKYQNASIGPLQGGMMLGFYVYAADLTCGQGCSFY